MNHSAGNMDAGRILKAVNEKDKELWQEVFGYYYAALCSYAGRLVQESVIAEDLVQDILLYVWNSERKFVQMEELTNYLYRATYNRAMMWLRREKCKSKHLGRLMEENGPEFDEMFIETVREELLRQMYLYIEELPPEQRKVIRMSVEGLSVNEIAEKLGISVNTVKTHKKRSFKQLRGKIKGDANIFWLAFFLS